MSAFTTERSDTNLSRMAESRHLLDDLQASPPEVRLGLSRAGVQGVGKAIRLRWGGAEKLISAEIDCTVDLDPAQKGVHMSRFPELFEEAIDEVVIGEAFLVEELAEHIARHIVARQAAGRAEVRIVARYPLERRTPVTRLATQELILIIGIGLVATPASAQVDQLLKGLGLGQQSGLSEVKIADGLKQALQVASKTTDRRLIPISKFNLAKVAVTQGRSREGVATLRALAGQADNLGLKYLSLECSVYLGEALINSKDFARALPELDRTKDMSDKLGLLTLQAKSQYLLATALRLTGKGAEASRQYAGARRTLDEIRKEAKSEDVLKRADLGPMYAESTKWSQSPPA